MLRNLAESGCANVEYLDHPAWEFAWKMVTAFPLYRPQPQPKPTEVLRARQ
jgi:hypothetical protein